ncbi:hypothetical protein R6Q59_010021 [Mikania micrantha]
MVLELILIGGVVFYYVKKNKKEKLQKAALQRGEPFHHPNGAVTFPPGYPDLPPYTQVMPPMADYRQQSSSSYNQNAPREQPYSDHTLVHPSWQGQKSPPYTESREVVNEKN